MKNVYLEKEETPLGRKPKKVKMNHRLIEKIGKALYHIDGVKSIKVQVSLNSGSVIAYQRCEEEDEDNNFRKKHMNRED